MHLVQTSANRLGALALCSLLTLAAMPMTACQNLDQQIQADGAAIATAVQQIAALEQGVNADLSAKLSQGATALLAAVKNFSSTSAAADVVSAANAIEAVLAVIPQTAAFAPLVPIAVAAIEVLLANLPGSAAPAAKAIQAHAMVRPKVAYAKAEIKHRFGRTVEGDFKAAWNAQAAKIPGATPIK